jgi:hypothetical protein
LEAITPQEPSFHHLNSSKIATLVEHFKFFSEKIGEKCPLFFALYFTDEKLKKFSPVFWF